MSTLAQNISTLLAELEGTHCRLVAVSKTKPVELIQEAYDCGLRIFGENKVQEMTDKMPLLPQDIEWHLIGHLQTNKVKYIAPFVAMIHSVDSLRLLAEINKRAAQHNRVIDCLLQIHIAQEETKFGLDAQEAHALLQDPELASMQNIRLKGLMGMATFTDNTGQVRAEFRSLHLLFEELRNAYSLPQMDFTEVSMGMSGDYQIAIEEGSTLIRVGSSLFGSRS